MASEGPICLVPQVLLSITLLHRLQILRMVLRIKGVGPWLSIGMLFQNRNQGSVKVILPDPTPALACQRIYGQSTMQTKERGCLR